MDQDPATYGRYPWATPVLENFVWLGTFTLGAFLCSLSNGWAAAAYLGYSLVCIYLLIPKWVCTRCSYHGRLCHSGQGMIAGLLFSRRDASSFGSYFKYNRFAAPVFLAPLVVGLILCVFRFSWGCLELTAAFGLVALGCTRAVTCRLGCPHCRQKAVCPAFKKFRDRRGILEMH